MNEQRAGADSGPGRGQESLSGGISGAGAVPGGREAGIWSASFQGLLWTNFFTAVNDNVFRWFVIGTGKEFWPVERHPQILMWGTICFVLPYIVFAIPAGWLADRFSKRDVILGCKFLEIVVMLLGVGALLLQNFPMLLFVVFLMGTQSALFAPAKVGKIPELLDESRISAGNGLFNLSTLTAVIIGTGIGNWLADVTGRCGQERIWLTLLVLVGIAVVGTMVGFLMRRVPAAAPGLPFPSNPVSATVRQFGPLLASSRLFRVALGVTFFWTFASLAQVNVDAFADENGLLLETEKLPLLISLVLGVGGGSVLAGILSQGKIELGLVPVGALGMVLFAALIWWLPPEFLFLPPVSVPGLVLTCVLFGLLGVSAGFFDVPLSSWLQFNSPVQARGSVLAAANLTLFASIIVTTLLYANVLRGAWRRPDPERSLPVRFTDAALDPAQRDQSRRIGEELNQDLLAAIAAGGSPLEVAERINGGLAGIGAPVRQAVLTRAVTAVMSDPRVRDAAHSPFHLMGIPLDESARAGRAGGGDAALPAQVLEDQRQVRLVQRAIQRQPLLSARAVFLLLALVTLPVFGYTVYRLHRHLARILLWSWLRLVYRIRVHGREHLPDEGPAVLIANHYTWIDALFLMLLPRREIKAVAWAGNFGNKAARWFADYSGVILISGGPKSIARGIRTAREALQRGEMVLIFPEGGLSRTGQIQAFRPGVLKIAEGTGAPVIPVYLDQLWGSFFSYQGGKAMHRIPRTFRRPVSIHIGRPLPADMELGAMRQTLQEMGSAAARNRTGRFESPVRMFLRQCRRRLFRFKIGDSTGQDMTGGALLMRTLILRRLLRRHVLGRDEKMVGVLIPPSSGGIVVNMALALDRRVAVNLNYSVTDEIMQHCIREAGIRHVLTTEKVLEKFSYDFGCEVTRLDELRTKVTLGDKIICALLAYLVPAGLTGWIVGGVCTDPDELMTVIFTSGSTGMPKGVMLSHRNVASNVEAVEQVVSLRRTDTIIGVLPLFHSFGYTITMWTVMSLDVAGAYHFSPLDARQVGKLVEKYRGTVLLCTPTFLRGYLRKCTAEEFSSLEIVVLGAEKMPVELADEFEKKYGLRPIEGYGATELSPLVSVNIPPTRRLDNFQTDCKEGTVGRPIPNVTARVDDLETGRPLGADQPGMLWITGPNVMLGYLNQPDKTAEVVVDGWYRTGDVAVIDSEGFIRITGRISRFSKIGGEMVPHVTVENTLLAALGGVDDVPVLAVTAVPDERKGERLVVLHTAALSRSPDELIRSLQEAGLPNLFIPSRDSFLQVEAIPVLGSGKIDLKRLPELARELLG